MQQQVHQCHQMTQLLAQERSNRQLMCYIFRGTVVKPVEQSAVGYRANGYYALAIVKAVRHNYKL